MRRSFMGLEQLVILTSARFLLETPKLGSDASGHRRLVPQLEGAIRSSRWAG
jgi:hypothetical protein